MLVLAKYLLLIVITCIPTFVFAQVEEKLKLLSYYEEAGITVGNGIAFRPNTDEFYYSAPTEMRDDEGRWLYKIFRIEFLDSGSWSEPQKVSFSSNYTEYHPVFSPQGNQIYYNSRKPKPGNSDSDGKGDIWRVTKTQDGWGEPEYLSDINTSYHDTYPTVALDGTLYFNSDRPGGKGSMDIYKAEPLLDGSGFTEPEPLFSINTKDSENDLFVDPEERFLIFNRYLFEQEEIELYISFKKEDQWSQPEPINAINQKGVWELTPTISPDGKRLFLEINGEVLFVEMDLLLRSVGQ